MLAFRAVNNTPSPYKPLNAQYDWQLLRIYSIYRLMLASSILVIFLLGRGPNEDVSERYYFAISITYLGMCVLTALVIRARSGKARSQALITVVIDILMLAAL